MSSETKWRKKPVVIDAVQFDGSLEGYKAVERFVGETLSATGSGGGWLSIPTLEGALIASPGDWIIRGVKGEFYPCKPDIFADTYEPASSSSSARAPEAAQDIRVVHDALAFLKSVIQSGEAWTPKCQATYDFAGDALDRLGDSHGRTPSAGASSTEDAALADELFATWTWVNVHDGNVSVHLDRIRRAIVRLKPPAGHLGGGVRIVSDESVPRDEAHVYQDGKRVGSITNIGGTNG